MTLTKQEVFDKVCDHFKTQKEQAFDEGCQYFTENGLKCAIGIFLPDGHKAQEFVGVVASLFVEYPDIGNLFEKSDDMLTFLEKIQDTHDDEHHWDEKGFNAPGWVNMSEIAEEYELNTSHIG